MTESAGSRQAPDAPASVSPKAKRPRVISSDRAELVAVRDVLRTLSESPFDLTAMLAIVVEHAVKLCGADFGYVHLPDGPELRLAGSYGIYDEKLAYMREHPIPADRRTTTGRAFLSGRLEQIPDVYADPEWAWRDAQQLHPYRSTMSVPIRKETRIVGVFTVSRTVAGGFSDDEGELLGTFADQAAIVIDNVRLLGTIDRQREELASYLPSTVAELISSPEGEQLLEGHRRDVTAVFCDLRGFTAFAEAAEPEEVLSLLRQYHQEMGTIIVTHHGTLEHYAGDGMMVFLNDPEPVADHALEGARMAVAMRDRFAGLAAGWRRQGFELGMGIGISVGYATLGRIGFKGHYGYAVIGSVANLAARLCALAEPGQIVLSERAYMQVESRTTGQRLGSFELKGFRRPVEAYALTGMASSEQA